MFIVHAFPVTYKSSRVLDESPSIQLWLPWSPRGVSTKPNRLPRMLDE